jgi:uncharacterized protein YycO
MAVCSSLLYRIPWSCYDAKFGMDIKHGQKISWMVLI